MRRDKAATRILLILSFIHVAAAAPPIIRQRSLEVTKDVTLTSEKRGRADDESSRPFQQMDNNLPSTSETLPSQGVTSPAENPQLHSDPPAELGNPQLQDETWPAPGDSQLHSDPPSRGSQVHDDPPPEFGSSQLHDDRPIGFGSSGSHRWQAASPSPDFNTEAPILHSETPQPLELEAPPSGPQAETHTFLTPAMRDKLIIITGLGAFATAAATLGISIKLLMYNHNHRYDRYYQPESPYVFLFCQHITESQTF
jgi:hypothetical protein